MDLTPLGFPAKRSTVVVLGAGATRGASFVQDPAIMKPPIDSDFFAQLHLAVVGKSNHAGMLREFLEEEFGSLSVGMESFYSQVQLFDRFVGDVPKGQRGKIRKYKNALGYFLECLPGVFEATIGARDCRFHEILVDKLSATDTIVSFNYDCVMDRALARTAGGKWDPGALGGYGFEVKSGAGDWMAPRTPGRPRVSTLTLLKPHGSLNWARNQTGISLIPDEFAKRSPEQLVIVPPLWFKTYDELPFGAIWSSMRKVLGSTKALVFVGYSLPPTDVYAQAALRLDVGPLDFLCIVNPDSDSRHRIRSVLRSSLTVKTRVVELSYLAELAILLNRSATP